MTKTKAPKVKPDSLIPAPAVAERLGIAEKTLHRWRLSGHGPRGWSRSESGRVFYRESAVEAYLSEREARAAGEVAEVSPGGPELDAA